MMERYLNETKPEDRVHHAVQFHQVGFILLHKLFDLSNDGFVSEYKLNLENCWLGQWQVEQLERDLNALGYNVKNDFAIDCSFTLNWELNRNFGEW